ncbi:MAG: hypothetical protein ICV59_04200 [Thermoleophilia bacterium]|nr:hypothetical protein [Thermoleophilia bacterium]
MPTPGGVDGVDGVCPGSATVVVRRGVDGVGWGVVEAGELGNVVVAGGVGSVVVGGLGTVVVGGLGTVVVGWGSDVVTGSVGTGGNVVVGTGTVVVGSGTVVDRTLVAGTVVETGAVMDVAGA